MKKNDLIIHDACVKIYLNLLIFRTSLFYTIILYLARVHYISICNVKRRLNYITKVTYSKIRLLGIYRDHITLFRITGVNDKC